MLLSGSASCDPATPSESQTATVAVASTPDVPVVDYEEAARALTSVFPIRLDRYEQVTQHSFNWRGVQDAALNCELGFTPEAVLVKGQVLDDDPFFQTMEHPAMPDWWRIRYGGDGIEFRFEDPTSTSRRLQFVLNLSSAGVSPTIDLLASPVGIVRGNLPGSSLRLLDLQVADNPTSASLPRGFLFTAALPVAGIVDPKFFTGPLRINVRLHDADGDMKSYLMLEETLEKKQ